MSTPRGQRARRRGGRRGARGEAGLTLLEVMIALAILGLTLVPIIHGHTLAVAAAQHAKLLTIATQLAREKMEDYETTLNLNGFCLQEQEEEGDFSEEGYPKFKWKTRCEKIELPTGDKIASAIQQGAQGASGSGSDTSSLGGFTGGASVVDQAQGQFAQLASQIPFIQNILETAVRRVTVTVMWRERGAVRELPVMAYLVDIKSVQAFSGGLAAAAGQAGQPGQPGQLRQPEQPGKPGQPGSTTSSGTGTGATGATTGRPPLGGFNPGIGRPR